MNLNLPYSSKEIESILIAFGWTKQAYWSKGFVKRATMFDAWNYQFNEIWLAIQSGKQDSSAFILFWWLCY